MHGVSSAGVARGTADAGSKANEGATAKGVREDVSVSKDSR